jgi:hypothetical protein
MSRRIDHLDSVRIPGGPGMARSRHVFRRAVYALPVLQQAMPRLRERPGGRPI